MHALKRSTVAPYNELMQLELQVILRRGQHYSVEISAFRAGQLTNPSLLLGVHMQGFKYHDANNLVKHGGRFGKALLGSFLAKFSG